MISFLNSSSFSHSYLCVSVPLWLVSSRREDPALAFFDRPKSLGGLNSLAIPVVELRLGDGPLAAVIEPGLYRCGDWCEDVSINGALLSGRRAGEAVMTALGEPTQD